MVDKYIANGIPNIIAVANNRYPVKLPTSLKNEEIFIMSP